MFVLERVERNETKYWSDGTVNGFVLRYGPTHKMGAKPGCPSIRSPHQKDENPMGYLQTA